MLCRKVIVTLLASIGILKVGASQDGEQRALPNERQMPVNKSGIVLGALTVQQDNVYKTGPNDRSIYDSIVQQETDVYESPDSSWPSRTYTQTVMAPGGPGKQGTSYAGLGERQHQGKPNGTQESGNKGGIFHGSYTYQKGNTYYVDPNANVSYGSVTIVKNSVHKSGGGDKQAPKNEGQIPTNQGSIHMGSITVQTGNTYVIKSGGKNFFGSRTYQEGNQYQSRGNQQAPNSSSGNTKSQTHSEEFKESNGQTRLSPSSLQAPQNEGQIPTNKGNNHMGSITVQTGNTYVIKSGGKNFFGSRTYQERNQYLSRGNQQTPNSSSGKTKSQLHSEEFKESNGQMRLSSYSLSLLLLSWVVLSKCCIL